MIRMWGRSLITIQRVDKATWLKLDIVSRVKRRFGSGPVEHVVGSEVEAPPATP